MALCARTVTDQFGMWSTVNLAVSVVPDTVFVNVPASSLPIIVIWYWSIGLSPGTAACQVATSVSFAPAGSGSVQLARTLVGAQGATEAATVVTRIKVDAGLDPPIVVFTAVISYMVWGCSDAMTPFVAAPATVVVSIEAVELTGIAISVDDVTAVGSTRCGVQET